MKFLIMICSALLIALCTNLYATLFGVVIAFAVNIVLFTLTLWALRIFERAEREAKLQILKNKRIYVNS